MNSTEKNAREESLKISHQQLIQAIASNACVSSYNNLFVFFSPRLHAYGLGQLANSQLASELVQETMSNVWHKAFLYNASKGSVSCWIFAIARNVKVDIQRQADFRYCFIDGSEKVIEELAANEEWNSEKLAVTTEVIEYFEQLPLLQQQVLSGIYLEGKSQREVAEEMEVPIGTVKSRARLGVSRLKQAVA